MQMQMRAMGEADALVSEEIAELIKLSPADKLRIRDRAIRVDQDLRDQIDQLIRQARKKIRAELNTEQQSLLNDLVGEEIDLRSLAPPAPAQGEAGRGNER